MRTLLLFLLSFLLACGGGSDGPPPPSGGGGGTPPRPLPTGVFKRLSAAPAKVTLPDPVMIVNELDAYTSDYHVVFPSLGQTYGRISINGDGTLAITGGDWLSLPGGGRAPFRIEGTWVNGVLTMVTPEGTFTFGLRPPVVPSGNYMGTRVAEDTSSGIRTTLTFTDSRNFRITDSGRDVMGSIQAFGVTAAVYRLQMYSANDQYHSQFGMAALNEDGSLTLMVANNLDPVPGSFYAVFR